MPFTHLAGPICSTGFECLPLALPTLFFVYAIYVVYFLIVVFGGFVIWRWRKHGRDAVTNLFIVLTVLLVIAAVPLYLRRESDAHRFDAEWQIGLDQYDGQAYQPAATFQDYELQRFGFLPSESSSEMYIKYHSPTGDLVVSGYPNMGPVVSEGECRDRPVPRDGQLKIACAVVGSFRGSNLYRESGRGSSTSAKYFVKVGSTTFVIADTKLTVEEVKSFLETLAPVDKTDVRFVTEPRI